MNLEEMFKSGVTPIAGENAGKRYRVVSINEKDISVREWDSQKFGPEMKHGEYRVWTPPKTVFDDVAMVVTWGELKRAMAQKGFGDDARLYVRDPFRFYGFADANVGIGELDGKKVVYFY